MSTLEFWVPIAGFLLIVLPQLWSVAFGRRPPEE